eukprot:7664981-Prorocentrum_lima.AAC.1
MKRWRRCRVVDEKYMRFALYMHGEKLVVLLSEARGWTQQAAACPPVLTFVQCPRAAWGSRV